MNFFFAYLFLTALSIQFVFSQEVEKIHPILTDRFQFNTGLYTPSKTVKIGAHGSTPNENFDFSEALGFDKSETTLFLNFDWYFTKKWKFSTEYFSVKNIDQLSLKQDIIWEDYTLKEGSNIKAGFGLDMYRIFVGRVFSKGLKHEFGAGLGVHALNTYAFIEGEFFINEEDFVFDKKSVSGLIPLPNIGFWYYYAPTPKWAFTARLDWFGITINEYSGYLWNVGPGINYQIFKNFGLGINYRYFKATAKVDETDWDGKFNLIFQGPVFTITGSF